MRFFPSYSPSRSQSRYHRTLAAVATLALLVAPLLVAQLAGLQHRIEHPFDLVERVTRALNASEHGHAAHDGEACELDDGYTHHDCAAYDSATLSHGPPLSDQAALHQHAAADRASVAEHAWFSAAPTLGYSSRAPPRA